MIKRNRAAGSAAVVLGWLWAGATLAEDAAPPVSLYCEGAVVSDATRESSSSSRSSTGRRRETETWATRTRKTAAAVSVVFDPAGPSRIRLSSELVPGMNSGSVDGWWTLNDVAITPDRFTGRFRLNVLNKPVIVVDRMSGGITVEGLSTFKGACRKADPAARKF